MKFALPVKIALAATGLLVVGGFLFLSLAPAPVSSSTITKTIPNERFLEKH